MAGNTRSQANAQNDAGRVADDLAMDHMLIQLQRPPEQELQSATEPAGLKSLAD
jgi:hypothetical protein